MINVTPGLRYEKCGSWRKNAKIISIDAVENKYFKVLGSTCILNS